MSKKLEEVEKAKDQAEQDGYEMGVAKTKEAFRAEVSEVCRHYYLQVWNEAFNQTGVDASSTLRRAESAYYPPTIRTSVQSLFKEAGLLEAVVKPTKVTKEVTHDAI